MAIFIMDWIRSYLQVRLVELWLTQWE